MRVAMLKAIVAFYDGKQYPPTYRDVLVACELNPAATGHASYMLQAYIDAGYVRKIPLTARGLIPTDAGRAFLAAAALREGAE